MAKKSYDLLFKLLLIGDSGVGKTCILFRFSDDAFNTTFISTIGIDFKIKTIELGGKRIKLQIWDTAGQERFHTITTSYYRGAMGIILVYDLTNYKSFENISKWLRNIDEHASEDVEKLLLGNKCDVGGGERVVTTEKGRDIAAEHNIPFLETSAKTNINIDEAFHLLAGNILSRVQQHPSPNPLDSSRVSIQPNSDSSMAESNVSSSAQSESEPPASTKSTVLASQNRNLDEELTQIYHKWDPLGEEDASFLNSFGYNYNDPSSLITGSDAILQTSDVQCPFYDGTTEKCFKQKCYYKHDKLIAQAIATGNTKYIDSITPSVQVTVSEQLGQKQIATEGSVIVGRIVNIVTPNEFYVIPESDWSCICDKASIQECKAEFKYSGNENMSRMWESLDYYTSHHSKQSLFYNQGELVAVKLDTGPKTKQWYRATVTQEVALSETNEMPAIDLRLVDLGTFVHTSTRNVISLPEQFLHYPPLAYKCSIFGVSPITHKWSRRAIEFFRTLGQEQSCLIEIKQSIHHVEEQPLLFEADPYLVALHVKVNGEFANIASKLIEEGLGLEWHPYPARPHILDVLPAAEARGFSSLTKPFGEQYSEEIPKVPEVTIQREIQRLARYLNRNPQ